MNENLKAERDSALLFVSLAEEFLNNGSYEEAVNYCNMALSQFPDMKEAMIMLYKTYMKSGDNDNLNSIAEQLKTSFPDDEQVKDIPGKDNAPQAQAEHVNAETAPAGTAEPEKPQPADLSSITAQPEMSAEENEVMSADQAENLLDNALEEINAIKGVLGSIIIEESGIIIKDKVTKGLDAEIAAALFSIIFMVSEDSVGKIQLGLMDRIFIEVGKIRIYLFKGDGYIVGIFTEEIVKIGLIHVKAKQLIRDIKKVLG